MPEAQLTKPAPQAAIWTVPAGQGLLDALAQAILAGDLPRAGGLKPDLLDLPAYTILLPTRRSARALQEAFLRATGGRSMLLPRIRPIAEGDEDATLLAGLGSLDTLGGAGADIPPAVSEIERRLTLTQLVIGWSNAMRSGDGLAPMVAAGAQTPAQAAALARELASLMDAVETENVALSRLTQLVPDNFSEHWQKTLQFLDIALSAWPAYLAERGLLSPADRRNRIILTEARRIATTRPDGPLIAAGITGSIPATAEMMRAIIGLGQGAIVLPDLDLDLDEASWRLIGEHHPEHPQFGLARLLGALGIERSAVRVLAQAALSPKAAARSRIVAQSMRPAATTQAWRDYIENADKDSVRSALTGIGRITAPTEQDEAEAIALIMRHAAETPGRTAALVSPDRLLARRVAIRLEAWGIRVDDSAGRPFAKTVPGTFLDLVLEAVRTEFAPAPLMALLKHPLTRLGLTPFDVRKAGRALEIAALRTTYLGRGTSGLDAALTRAEQDRAARKRRTRASDRLWDEDLQLAHDLMARLAAATAPLVKLIANRRAVSLRVIADAHVATAEAIARLPEADQPSQLWEGEAGVAATQFFAGLLDSTLPSLDIMATDYPDLYRSLIVGENVRSRIPVHPRLSIWGPFEARLQKPDVVILGSLNEGTWPEAADPGPWLNRPMRAELGLPQPEQKIGHAAHDFTQLLGAETVYLTRAMKIGGVPTVASRWLLRLDALLAGLGVSDALEPADPWLGWARARDVIGTRVMIHAPEPRPPLTLRPRSLSVSDIERWIANPYSLFATKILGLEALPLLDAEPDAALRGGLLHEALGRFAMAYPQRLPDDCEAALLAIARDVLTDYAAHPRIAAFWLPRLERFARWFGETEAERRTGVVQTLAEIDGREILPGPAGPFTLRARADRIDVLRSGIVITDYKTANNLAKLAGRALTGEAPQLPLEAAIAAGGGFANLDQKTVLALRYVSASGGEPPGDEQAIKTTDVAQLAGDARTRLERLIAAFDDPATPYRAVRRAKFNYDYDEFAHLARVAEWSAEGAEAEGEA